MYAYVICSCSSQLTCLVNSNGFALTIRLQGTIEHISSFYIFIRNDFEA